MAELYGTKSKQQVLLISKGGHWKYSSIHPNSFAETVDPNGDARWSPAMSSSKLTGLEFRVHPSACRKDVRNVAAIPGPELALQNLHSTQIPFQDTQPLDSNN